MKNILFSADRSRTSSLRERLATRILPAILLLGAGSLALRTAAAVPLTPLWAQSSASIRVNSVTFSPNGQYFASAGGVAKIWRLQNKRFLFSEPDSGYGSSVVAFTPDSQSLIWAGTAFESTGVAFAKVIVNRLSDGHALYSFTAHHDYVYAVAVAPDGASFVTAGGTADGTGYAIEEIKQWRFSDGQLLQSWVGTGHISSVTGLAFSPDGKFLAVVASHPAVENDATAGDTEEVQLWPTTAGSTPVILDGSPSAAGKAVFSPDGTTLATGSVTGNVLRWSIPAGTPLPPLATGDTSVYGVAFSTDGKTLASSGTKPFTPGEPNPTSEIRLWNAGTDQPIRTLGTLSGATIDVALSPGGVLLAAAGGGYGQLGSPINTMKLFRTGDGSDPGSFPGPRYPVYSVAFSPDGRRMASAGGGVDDFRGRHGELALSDADDGTLLQAMFPNSILSAVAYSPDGHTLATGGGFYGWSLSQATEGYGAIWSGADGTLIQTLSGLHLYVEEICFSPDGTKIASAGGGYDGPTYNEIGEIFVFDSHSGATLQSLSLSNGPVYSIAYSPDGQTLVSSERSVPPKDGTPVYQIQLRNTSDLTTSRVLAESANRTLRVAVSPNGQLVAAVNDASEVKLIEVANGQVDRSFKIHEGAPRFLAFSADSQLLISAVDGTVEIWRASDGQLLQTLENADGTAVAVSLKRGRVGMGRMEATVAVSGFDPLPVGGSPVVLSADLNADGIINLVDARLLLLAFIQGGDLTPLEAEGGDQNGDGRVDVRDATLILRKTVGL